MPLSNVSESDTFTTNVQIPADGDAADASDFLASTIQPLTNRTRWLKNALAVLQVFRDGGALTLLENLTYTVASGKILTLTGQQINLSGIFTRFNGKVLGQLFTPGQEGMANRKTLYVASGTGAFTVDPDAYDTVFINSGISGARQVELTTSTPGAHIKVISLATAFACNLQRPSGGGQIGPDIRYTSGDAFVVEALCTPDGTWRLAGQQPFTL